MTLIPTPASGSTPEPVPQPKGRWSVMPVRTLGDERGLLSVVSGSSDLPFAIARVFWVHGLPPGILRGTHAHRDQHQAIVCLHGAVDCLIDDGRARATVCLKSPRELLHIPPLIWGGQTSLAPGTVYVVLSSGPYDRAEYLETRESWHQALREFTPEILGKT